MLDFLRIKFHCMGLILKNKEKTPGLPAGRMFLSYIKFTAVYIFCVRLLGLKLRQEKGLGLIFNFYSYKIFLNLFEEIFIYKTYSFAAANQNPVIIDCGSNIGMSVLYFKKIYPGSVIKAFEADREAFVMLEKNIADNKLAGVTLVNRALYGTKGKTLKFYSNENDSGNPVNGLVKRPEEFSFKKPVKVVTDTLSGHIAGKVDFLKMDIEGAEYGVLKEINGKGKLGYIREGVLEYHHHLVPGEDRIGEVLFMFEKNGFGSQFSTWTKPPFHKDKFQDLNIYFYKKRP